MTTTLDRPEQIKLITQDSVGLQAISEAQYKPDLELLDRYVGFSSELVRVSLLGLAAIGFYLKEFVATPSLPRIGTEAPWFLPLLGTAAAFLALAVACGLLHRFYATDGLGIHVKALRFGASRDLDADLRDRTQQYRIAGSWLVSCQCAVGAGVGLLGIAFGVRFGVYPASQSKVAVYAAATILIIATGVAAFRWFKTLFRRKR